jgi:hypothetical protein
VPLVIMAREAQLQVDELLVEGVDHVLGADHVALAVRSRLAPSAGPSRSKRRSHSPGYQCACVSMTAIGFPALSRPVRSVSFARIG